MATLLLVGVARAEMPDISALEAAARSGDAYAQLNLGAAYDNGIGVTVERTQAAYWYRKAAEQGVPEAQFNLGHLYATGEAGEQDYAEAARWLGLAAAQGVSDALYMLGVMHAQGLGVEEDDSRAWALLKQAAEARHEAAAEYLQQHYRVVE